MHKLYNFGSWLLYGTAIIVTIYFLFSFWLKSVELHKSEASSILLFEFLYFRMN